MDYTDRRKLFQGTLLFDRVELADAYEDRPVLGRFRIDGKVTAEGMYRTSGIEVQSFRARDQFNGEAALVKVFACPTEPRLAETARAIWEREMRTTHLASTGGGGVGLLRVIDSRHLVNDGHFVLVTEYARQSLRAALESEHAGFLERARRGELWKAVQVLLEALGSLHAVGMIHRNICLDAIYLADDPEAPLLKLGDYSWTVYLHGLAGYLGTARPDSTGRFRVEAPELRGNAIRGESHSTDLYAMGVALGRLFSTTFREGVDRGIIPSHQEALDMLRSDAMINEEERLFFSNLLNDRPEGRFDSASRAADFARQVAARFEQPTEVMARSSLMVSFDTRTTSPKGRKNLDNLSKWVEINGLGGRMESWIRDDLKGQGVYPNGFTPWNPDMPRIFMRGKSGVPYSAIPYTDRRTGRILQGSAVLEALSFDPAQVGPQRIAVLGGGVTPTPYPWDAPNHGDTWGPIFAAAKAQARAPTAAQDSPFNTALDVIHRAEESLIARRILPVRVTNYTKVADGFEVWLEMRAETRHPQSRGLAPVALQEWWDSMAKERSFDSFLAKDADLYQRFNQAYRVELIKCEGMQICVRLPPGQPLGPFDDWWLHPGDAIAVGFSLKSKHRAIRQCTPDDYLVRAVEAPHHHSVFLEDRGSDETWETILNTRPMFALQGPPGTGKTFTATRVITQGIRRGLFGRILVIAQAHKPLDHVLRSVRTELELDSEGYPISTVRLGEKRDFSHGTPKSLDEDLHLMAVRALKKSSQWSTQQEGLQDLASEWREYTQAELRSPGPAWGELLLRSAHVVFCTSMSGAIRKLERHPPFDLVIVEEAAKAYASELLAALRLGRNWLLIGDQAQLPPFQFNEMAEAARAVMEEDSRFRDEYGNLDQAVMEAAMANLRFFGSLHNRMIDANYPYKPPEASKPAVMLKGQRRLPPVLANLIGTVFYDGHFENIKPETATPIQSLPELRNQCLVWMDTPSAGASTQYAETASRGGGYYNRGEAQATIALLESLKPGERDDVAILSPYNAQVELIRASLTQNKELAILADNVHSVDSFQGQEARLVIVSMVRNSTIEDPRRAIGFLRERERMNVILSRAKEQLVIIGNMRTIDQGQGDTQFLADVTSYVRRHGRIVGPEQVGNA